MFGACRNNNRAASILFYHMIPGVGSQSFTNLVTGQSVSTMLEGHNLTISKDANVMEMLCDMLWKCYVTCYGTVM